MKKDKLMMSIPILSNRSMKVKIQIEARMIVRAQTVGMIAQIVEDLRRKMEKMNNLSGNLPIM